jgi:hypothetical protein
VLHRIEPIDAQSCTVRFRLDRSQIDRAGTTSVVGDFNDWRPGHAPFVYRGFGGYQAAIVVPAGATIRVRYLSERDGWSNPGNVDASDGPNSVIHVTPGRR